MLSLRGGTFYLVMRRAKGAQRKVAFHARFDDCLTQWDSGTRLSPVFATEDAKPPSLKSGTIWFLFLGPVDPGKISLALGPTFVTLGLFNVLVTSRNKAERAAARKQATQLGVPWEEWELRSGTIKNVVFSPSSAGMSAPTCAVPAVANEALVPAAREYATTMTAAQCRARQACVSFLPDLEQFDSAFRALLRGDATAILKQRLLVNANAALSRETSQTFAGISPISETECHFWTHSLLGIGIASLALQRLRRFIGSALLPTELPDRLRLLSKKPPLDKRLIELSSNDEIWDSDPVFKATVKSDPKDPVVPLVTFFSGRDGFRSTEVSLSAPLETIEGCNATSWTLLTLTHEVSHTVIEGVLGVLLPSPNSPDSVKEATKILTDGPSSLLDELKYLLCHTICLLDSTGTSEPATPAMLADHVRTHWQEVNELLTHVFDFLYFYQGSPETYVRAIWASWGVIPNIEHRIGDYITRSLCALHANNLRRADSITTTIDTLTSCLEEVAKEFPDLELIATALDTVKERRQEFEKILKRRVKLVRLVHSFLYSQEASSILMRDDIAGGGEHEGYRLRADEFAGAPVGNPLRFVEAFGDEKAPQQLKSLWILTHVAFSEVE
ncbi:MAG TPA: hypothetical protein VJN18_05175 [Polyangiaceae bacterium]|nr:hypothetical protein [Polyangiaceae bacterium]